MDTLTLSFGIYDVIIGAKNLQGSGTITDNLREQADLLDLSLLGVLNVYQDLTGIETNELLLKENINDLGTIHKLHKYLLGRLDQHRNSG